MTCPKSPNGVHVWTHEIDYCIACREPTVHPERRPKGLVESQRQPFREPIRAVAGAGAYGRSAEDWQKRRAGDV
jgi:hypothetical protein